jgi:hypothetical protein
VSDDPNDGPTIFEILDSEVDDSDIKLGMGFAVNAKSVKDTYGRNMDWDLHTRLRERRNRA